MPATDIASLPSAYDHAAAQEKWRPFWEERGYFHADEKSDKPPFSVVIPPPNVTGALHLGHALNNTLQDILCRMRRMQGFNVLWMPGTDHAGIATQARVEKRLLETEGKSRHDLGREGLVERIWEWKDQYEERILGQLKQLGCSCDWQRTRFTLDDQCARAVRETFFKLFADGKIYRGKRLVNWDTYLQTAVSDDEVFHEEVKGHFWSFRYPVIDPKPGEPEFVTIATTRPETMLGDTAVAVHPEPASQLDKVEAELREKLSAAPDRERATIESQLDALDVRRQAILPGLIQLRDMAARGVKLKLPLSSDGKGAAREIPLIADIWAKPELGSGCVKITPAHDPNDYEVWQRNQEIGAINILNPDGTLNDNVPEEYRGLSMKKARARVVDDLAHAGFHDPETDVEDRLIDLAHSDRSKTPIEPYLADQWFVRMGDHYAYKRDGTFLICGHVGVPDDSQELRDNLGAEVASGLAQSAIDAVESSAVRIFPSRYAKTYVDWLSEKRDWPVGRQLWWGHRIPVWKKRLRSKAEHEAACEEAVNLLSQEAMQWPAREDGGPGGELNESFVDDWDDSAGDGYAYYCLRSDDSAVLTAIEKSGYTQDEEVLDTWFSSALWPFSTMGWPEETDLLKTFYPTSTLITSRDIITLWVARMVLMGEYADPLNNGGQVPFKEVYIHPKILDGFGETMSKSKGNGVDPLDVIDKFGADALRFGIAYLTTETQDVRMPVEFVCPHCDHAIAQTKKNRVLPRLECPACSKPFGTQWAETEEDLALPRGAVTSERFELGRNFCNKLWNASRFALTNLEGYSPAASAGGSGIAGGMEPNALASGDLKIEDRWLLSRLSTVTTQVTEALESYRYADAARTLYDFAWNEFCSFYVEMTKARFAGDDKAVAQGVLAHALDTLLRLLHPMTPFLTEEVWQLLGEVAPRRGLGDEPARDAAESVCIAEWPKANAADASPEIERQFAVFQEALSAVREVRQAQNIPWSETLEFAVTCDDTTAALLEPMTPYFAQMAKAAPVATGPKAAAAEVAVTKSLPSADAEVHVDVSRFIDVEAEIARLEKDREQKTKFAKSLEGKLSNANFVSRAPAEVVEAERAKLAEAQAALAAIEAALEKLK